VFEKATAPLDVNVVNFADPGLDPPMLKLSKLPVEPEDKFTALVLPARDTLKLAAGAPGAGAAIEKLPLTATDCIAKGGTTPPGPGAVSTVPTSLP
jgi:hypothetical protein